MTMAGPDRLAQAQAVIARLFPDGVAVTVSDPLAQTGQPLGPEGAHLTNAVTKRRNEFRAGRVAAADAMRKLGQPLRPVFAGEDRAPIWPEGLRGSISHSDTLCAAALTDQPLYLGLDVEAYTPLSANLLPTICSDAECAKLSGPRQLQLAKLLFSIKEACYKAQYPLTNEVFGFHHFDVSLDLDQQTFVATFTQNVAPFAAGDQITGRFAEVLDHIASAATIPASLNQGD